MGQWSAAAPGSRSWEGGCVLEARVLAPCTVCSHELRGWGDACLGFRPRSMVSWTVTLEPLVPSRTQLPFLYNAPVARW